MTTEQKNELYVLLNGLCEGVLTESQQDRLDEILKSDRQACEIYIDFTSMWSDLRYFQASLYSLNGKKHRTIQRIINSPEEVSDSAIWKALAADEKTAPTVDMPHDKPKGEQIPIVVYRAHEKRKLSKFNFVFLAMNAAAMLFFFLFLRFAPPKGGNKVATLTDSIDAKWADNTVSFEKGARIATGNESLLLRKGYAELLFDTNARVVIEAPAEFQIVADDRISLNYGKIYSQVPKEAIGFSIYTPNSKIIDLGTEFGVETDFRGETRLHVMKGRTKLISGPQSDTQSIEVGEGEAKEISAITSDISSISCETDLFVRKINSTVGFIWKGQKEIDLADIVGGGNGFGTGKVDSGIETNTGRPFETPDPDLVLSKVPGILSGGGSYNKVSGLALIDGVFVPDSRKGPVQVTSEGDTFDGFVDGREVFWGNIFNGAWHASDTSFKHNLKLSGQTYGTRDNPAISLHSSQGITFDLQAIRQTIPGGRILRFTSLFGVSETVALDPLFTLNPGGPNQGKVNCWVLIDGKERFNRNSVSYLDGATEIEVDICNEDRFLTLVVTESEDRRAYDWALFANPCLLIELEMN
jgi:hypothetical protein